MRWDFDDKSEDFVMEMYKLTPKAMWWYILALGISAIVVIVLLAVIFAKSKNQKIEKITRWEVEENGK